MSDYDSLPEVIKSQITQTEWLWLSDAQKATYAQDQCDPDPEN